MPPRSPLPPPPAPAPPRGHRAARRGGLPLDEPLPTPAQRGESTDDATDRYIDAWTRSAVKPDRYTDRYTDRYIDAWTRSAVKPVNTDERGSVTASPHKMLLPRELRTVPYSSIERDVRPLGSRIERTRLEL